MSYGYTLVMTEYGSSSFTSIVPYCKPNFTEFANLLFKEKEGKSTLIETTCTVLTVFNNYPPAAKVNNFQL